MSELIQVSAKQNRLHLLASASALVMLSVTTNAAAQDSSPSFWIEVGGQYEESAQKRDLLVPPFLDAIVTNGFKSPLGAEGSLPWTPGGELKFSYEPSGSEWEFSGSIRFGRSNGHKLVHEQTPGGPVTVHLYSFTFKGTPAYQSFSHTEVSSSETHAVLDFRAGQDVGLGLFGRGATSNIGVGVRFAQVEERYNFVIGAGTHVLPTDFFDARHHNVYSVTNNQSLNFHGVGPTISWDATARLAGHADEGELDLAWGVNAGLLFGRQKASGSHQSTSRYHYFKPFVGTIDTYNVGDVVTHNRSRSVTTPNIGGAAGLSFRWINAKMSVGYRADAFFNALDTGLDSRKSSTVFYHGPFATISFGFGG